MISPEDIKQLTRSLGTIDGLRRVSAEIDRLRIAIAENQPATTAHDLTALKTALDGLSAAILEMRQVTRSILSESGAVLSYVG